MEFYTFTRQDIEKVADHPGFLSGVKIAVEEMLHPDADFFRGDPELRKVLMTAPRGSYWDLVKEYPLPYISPCEDPEFYLEKYGPNHHCTRDVNQDVETRNELLRKAKNKMCVEWWTYLHGCQCQALFITYPMCKILFPEKKFYLYEGLDHVAVVSIEDDKVLIYDPISQALNESLDWLFWGDQSKYSRANLKDNLIPEGDMVNWYVSNYMCEDMPVAKFNQWMSQWLGIVDVSA